jgi:hypothetical protein
MKKLMLFTLVVALGFCFALAQPVQADDNSAGTPTTASVSAPGTGGM